MVEYLSMCTRFSGRPTITLMTDFGLLDPYVGMMKGVILSILPQAAIVDLTHNISPQDIRQATFLLSTAINYFPPGTVHLVVVDPGVGGERRAIAVKTQRAYFVAPDNGVLTMALVHQPADVVVQLTNADYWLPHVSATFHGRDIFAPVAAHLARGIPIHNLGPKINAIVRLPGSQPARLSDGSILGQVQHIDRFGNCISNVPLDLLARITPLRIKVAGWTIQKISPSYDAVEPGQVVSVIGSTGFLEIAVRNGNAARQLGIAMGDAILIETH